MAVLLQPDEEASVDRPVLYLMREATVTERKLVPETTLVLVLAWACRKLRPYVAYREFDMLV